MRPSPSIRRTPESWEVGFKMDPTDTVRLNVALFTTDYDDIQMTYRLGVVPLLFNAGVASIDGWRARARIRAHRGIPARCQPRLSLDRNSTSITPPPPFGPVTPTATATLKSRLPFTPEWQAHLGLSYDFHVGSSWKLTPRADVSYTESQFFDAGNSRGDRAAPGRSRW